MDFLPINMRLRGRPVTLIGAGVVALRKARFLLGAGAELTVIAPEQDPGFGAMLEDLDAQRPERVGRRRRERGLVGGGVGDARRREGAENDRRAEAVQEDGRDVEEGEAVVDDAGGAQPAEERRARLDLGLR